MQNLTPNQIALLRQASTDPEGRIDLSGDKPVAVSTRLGKLGLSICYDLRFPELYRRLVRRGAQVLFVPSAFTAYPGPHHWLPLRSWQLRHWMIG